jgi:hypothetical protein
MLMLTSCYMMGVKDIPKMWGWTLLLPHPSAFIVGMPLPWGFTVWCFFGLIMHHVLFEGAQKQQTSSDLN